LEKELKFLGTVRGRLGVTVSDRLLVYFTGGLAYGKVESTALTTFTPAPAFTYSGSSSRTEVGWTIGGGGEYAMTNEWTIRGEYLYFRLPGDDYVATPLAANPPFAMQHTSDDFEGHIVRAAVNHKF
jgi:outer membrane immunogenic protein